MKKTLINIFCAITICFSSTAAFCESNLPQPDIEANGTWTTETNRQHVISSISEDIQGFQVKEQLVGDYVPVEAKIGMAFINAFSYVAIILDRSVVPFMMAFIIIAFAFWLGIEAYTIIRGDADLKSVLRNMVKRTFMVMIWVGILSYGARETFLALMAPIMQAATFMSDVILNAVTGTVGVELPDTCSAIHMYAQHNLSEGAIIGPEDAANIVCLPTRLSGFCYTAIKIGWRWMFNGVGVSVFSFIAGLVLIWNFIKLAWNFAFVAFGVIADLFLGVIMLPFTAVAETIGKTSYKGIVGDIFNTFIGGFHAENLQKQIARFVNAGLHFVILAIIISLSAALLSGFLDFDTSGIPSYEAPGFWTAILMATLASYMAKNAMKMASDLGGEIEYSMGETMKGDVKGLYKGGKKMVTGWYKAIKSARS